MRQRTILTTILTVFACVFAMAVCTNAKTIYVDADAPGANDGSSWADAYKYLQDALMFATGGDEIRVAQGVYRPDEFVLSKRPNLGREETFHLKNGVTLKGGYAGLSEPDPNARNIELYETILSGDRDGNDIHVNDPADLLDEPTRNENSYSVVIGSETDETSILDGFIITAGNANGVGDWLSPRWNGGGMYNNQGSPTVTNCIFRDNSAYTVCDEEGGNGGGMFNLYSNPRLINCTFTDNSAQNGSGGGGMYNQYSNPTLTDCTFSRNSASFSGGGMYNCDDSNPTLTNCTFRDNCTQKTSCGHRGDGGGMVNGHGNVRLTNCLFSGNYARNGGGLVNGRGSIRLTNCAFRGNRAELQGGALYNWGSSPTLTNCTVAGNSATNGNALGCDHTWGGPSTLQVINCILWNGGNEIFNGDSSNIDITYSDIKGGWPTGGNIDLDPCFASPGYWDPNRTTEDPNDDFWVDGDYHLKSQAGRWNPNEGRWTIDEVTSPCIDAGDPMAPIMREPFPIGGRIIMGAYGGTAEASKSYFGKPVCETIVAGDINGDCAVDFKDFVLMALHWLGGR